MAIAGREGLWEIMTDWEGWLYIQTENSFIKNIYLVISTQIVQLPPKYPFDSYHYQNDLGVFLKVYSRLEHDEKTWHIR